MVACLCLQPQRPQRLESSTALPGPMPGSYGARAHSTWVSDGEVLPWEPCH